MTEVKRLYRGVSADERQQRRRALLIDSCLELIGDGGIAAVTAESVSAAAKLTKRYFYESFPGRDAILVAALDDLFLELIAKIREAIVAADPGVRAEAITDVFVTTLCDDPRRARLYAESPALPALHERRENAIVAFTDLIVGAGRAGGGAGSTDDVRRRLMTRIVVAGVTDVVTSWINGVLVADRSTLTDAIVALGRTSNAS